MKKYLYGVCVGLTLFSYVAIAADAPMQPAVQSAPTVVDPITQATDSPASATTPAATTANDTTTDATQVFFKSLQSCSLGNYKEKNIIATGDADAWLNQQIIGLDEQGYCHTVLETPDGRKMDCYFDPYDLVEYGTPRFLAGMSALDADPSSKAGIEVEQRWSNFKDQNCTFKDSENIK